MDATVGVHRDHGAEAADEGHHAAVAVAAPAALVIIDHHHLSRSRVSCWKTESHFQEKRPTLQVPPPRRLCFFFPGVGLFVCEQHEKVLEWILMTFSGHLDQLFPDDAT